MITDAQVHLYDADTAEHPWPRDPWRPVPRIGAFTADEMIALMDEAGVDRAVIVPPIWPGAAGGYRTAADAAERYPGRFAIMRPFDPCTPDAKMRIEASRSEPHVLGFRMTWVRWDDEVPPLLVQHLQDGRGAELEWFWDACERLGIPLMCSTGERVRFLEPVIAAHPGLTVIIDHMASKHPNSEEGAFGGLDDLIRLARYPNAYVKACKAPDRSTEAYPFADVHPVVTRLLDAFGADRLMWATDASELLAEGVSYVDALRLWQEALGLTPEQQDWILGKTAATVLRWPEE